MRIEDLPTPVLLLDLEVLDRNLSRMQSLARRNNVRLRPHVKTHKCPAIAERQRALGAQGITVATFAEAEAFVAAGFDDVLWALPNPLSHMEGVLRLSKRARIRLLADDLGALQAIDGEAKAAGEKIHLSIKIDCGYHRAGVDPQGPWAMALIEAAARMKNAAFDGILTHAGHGYHAHDREELRAIARQERDVMVALAERARQSVEVREVSIGSTPTLSVAEDLRGISEIRPGNYVFYDYTQVALGSCALEDCALTVMASVISHRPGSDRLVVDAGALALSKDTGPDHLSGRHGMGRIFEDYPSRRLFGGIFLEQLSQEHGIVAADSPDLIEGRFRVGDRVRILEHHSCLCAAMFDEYHVVRGGEVVDRFRIERRR